MACTKSVVFACSRIVTVTRACFYLSYCTGSLTTEPRHRLQVIEYLRSSRDETDRRVADGYRGTIVDNMPQVDAVHYRAIDEAVRNKQVIRRL